MLHTKKNVSDKIIG